MKAVTELTYHGRPHPAVPCGTFGARSSQLYWLEMKSSAAVVVPRGNRGGASSILTHAGTSAAYGQFTKNIGKITWGGPGGARAAEWAAKQCRVWAAHHEAKAARLGLSAVVEAEAALADSERWAAEAAKLTALARAIGSPQVEPASRSFTDELDVAADALAHAAGTGSEAYRSALQRAADHTACPPSARLELDDMYGDVMTARLPWAHDHAARIAAIRRGAVTPVCAVTDDAGSPP